jgi:cell division protease FtsH
MNNDNKSRPEPRKGFPGGFIIFLLAGLLIFLTVQNMSTEPTAKVSFSHQIEALVDLDLLQPTESRKIAQNDNLVTFTGKFRDRQSDEAKARYKYLELLNRHNELEQQERQLQTELTSLQKTVSESADWFLHLSGIALPASGYWVIDPLYDTSARENSVVVKTLSDKPIVSLAELSRRYPPAETGVEAFGKDLTTLVQGFRSSSLGIGNEEMKQQLRTLEQSLAVAGQTPQQQITAYGAALGQLKTLVNTLNTETNNARLVQLRSVRNYIADLGQYNQVAEEMAKNDTQLDKGRQGVANVIWYFNNQELSSRALEKQDPEAFSNWFSQVKHEWDAFATNKGTIFRAPDQPRTLVLEKTFKSEEPSPNYFSYLFTILPFLFLGFLLYFIFARQMKGVGSGAMNFGKSPAKLLAKDRNKVTFKDVAGCDEAKEELQEIVEFLKDPGKFTALGARIPKGVLCIGAPGTGKTLIAKAVAGEADRPFFFISGSDFVEMFVGVGASRIRDMFSEARKFALALSSWMKSMLSAVIAVLAWAVAMMSASRPLTSSSSRWMDSIRQRGSS